MKRLLCILLCLCILGQSAMAAGGEEALPFADARGHWAKDYIAVCYESGLMVGVSDTEFDTEGSLTVAQCAAAAARLHARLTGGTEPAMGEPWYANYVRYMENLGLVIVSDVNSPCTREQFFVMMNLVVPAKSMTDINEINVLPDTRDEGILRFYRAGILTGMDEYGTFRGRLNLTRAECAAMMARIVDKSLRVRFRPERTDGSAAMDCLYIPASETALTIGGYNIRADIFTAVLNAKLDVQAAWSQLDTYPEYAEYLDKWLTSAYATDFKQYLSEFCGKGDYAETDWTAPKGETGKSYAQIAYEDTINWLYEHASLRAMAEKYKLKLTAKQEQEIENYLEKNKVKGTTRKFFVKTALEDAYLLEEIYKKSELEYSEVVSLLAKGEYLCVEYICFLKTDKAGNPLTEAEIDYIRHGAQLYLEDLKAKSVGHANFYRQTKDLNCAYVGPRATLWSKENAGDSLWLKLKNMQPVGLSEIIETEDGIYIYLVDNPNSNDGLMDEVCINYGIDCADKELTSFVKNGRLDVSAALAYLDPAEYAEKVF